MVFGQGGPHLQHLLIAEGAALVLIRSRKVLERLLLKKLVVTQHGAELARLVHCNVQERGELLNRFARSQLKSAAVGLRDTSTVESGSG